MSSLKFFDEYVIKLICLYIYYNIMNYKKIINTFIISMLCLIFILNSPVALADNHTTVIGEPDLEINIEDDKIIPGVQSNSSISITNNGNIDQGGESEYENEVMSAKDIDLNVETNVDSVTATLQNTDVGNISNGETKKIPIRFESDRDMNDNFTLYVTANYNHTSEVEYTSDASGTTVTNRLFESDSSVNSFDLMTQKVSNLDVNEFSSNISINESGIVDVELKNNGDIKAENIQIQLEPTSQKTNLGSSDTITIDNIDVNEIKSFKFNMSFSDSAFSDSTYKIDLLTSYDGEYVDRYTEELHTRIQPEPKRTIEKEIIKSNIHVGDTGSIDIELTNDNNVNLNDTTVNFETTSSEIFIGDSDKSKYIGDIESGDNKELSIDLSFVDSSDAKSNYKINMHLNYENKDNIENTINSNVIISPMDEREFDLNVINNTVPVDGFGDIKLELQNNNDEDFNDVSIDLTSKNSIVSFGSGKTSYSQIIGSLEEDESESFTVRTSTLDSADRNNKYTISGNISYTNEDDIKNNIKKDIQISPKREQDIDIDVIETNLSEGSESDLKLNIDNLGPKDLEDIQLSISSRQDISIKQPTRSLDKLASGDNKTKTFSVDVPLNSDTLTQDIDVTLEYTYNELPQSKVINQVKSININELDSEFNIEIKNNNIEQGSESITQVTVQNNLNETISSIDVDFSASSPLSVSDSSSYINELGPDEEIKLNVTTSASSGATPNSYPLDVDFKYVNEDGDTKLSEVYSLQINVGESESSIIPTVVAGLIIVLLVGLGAIYYRRRE